MIRHGDAASAVSPLRQLERELDRYNARAQTLHEDHGRLQDELAHTREFLELSEATGDRLEELATALFGEILDEVESNLTHAIREILGQNRTVTSTRAVKGGRLNVEFEIFSGDDEDQLEDIKRGQGGSVSNIMSMGLRLIALSQLDDTHHRPFLIFDEQDCWLRPRLVPKFMKIIKKIAHRLDIQVLAISHHSLDRFSNATDQIIELEPDRENGVVINKRSA